MQLDALRLFVKVAELGSFTRAADQLGVQKGRASVIVQQLEAELGTRLFHRTTRVVRLTPDGEQFLGRSQALLAEADELQTLFHQAPASLRGSVRIDLPTSLARDRVLPLLPAFLAAHPQLTIELSATDRRVDLVHEGFDCVVRVGTLADSGLVARRLGEMPQLNCASPGYLQAHGTPRSLAELDHHLLVHYAPTFGASPVGWEYHDGSVWRQRPMRGVITVNNADAYQAACLAGLGFIQVPAHGVQTLIDQGRLVALLPELQAPPMPVSLLCAHRGHLPKRVVAVMDWLAQVLTPLLR